jgi:hypothetical protein
MGTAITIANREDLIFLLSEAAELEHGLLCSYLFTAFSLKGDPDEGLADDELRAVQDWKETISGVAVEEMLHLTLVSNLLTAVGAAPHLRRPNFPQHAAYYPPSFQLTLTPFSEDTLKHFIFLERPEGVELEDPLQEDDFGAETRAAPASEIAPEPQDYATVGQLYRAIQDGVARLVDERGAARVFIGPERAQATAAYFQLPGLVAVTDPASARVALERIVEEGEGASGAREDAHYGRFRRIQREYRALKRHAPDFAPARPVLENPFASRPSDAIEVHLLDDPDTVRVADLCNGAYALMVQLLARFFAQQEETDDQLRALVGAAIALMGGVVRPLGELLTRLPAGPSFPDRTAGPSFEFYRSVNLSPHRRAAWVLFHERILELAAYADRLDGSARIEATATEVGARLRHVADSLGEQRPG